MGRFDGVNEAQTTGGGDNLGLGVHLLEIKRIAWVKSKDPQKNFADLFVVDLKVLASTNPSHVAGTTRSWVCNMTKLPAKGNVKGFIYAAAVQIGYTVAQLAAFTDAQMNALGDSWLSEENPMRGHRVRAEGLNHVTKEGNDYTRIVWSPWNGGEDAVTEEESSAMKMPG